MKNVDKFDLDVKIKTTSTNDQVDPNTTSVPCVQGIIASIRLCTRITCLPCLK